MIRRNYTAGITRWLAYGLLIPLISTMLVGCSTTSTSQEVWGRVDAKEVDVNSKIPGRVVSMLVKEGDIVTKGQVLARIDNRDIVSTGQPSARQHQSVGITDGTGHNRYGTTGSNCPSHH